MELFADPAELSFFWALVKRSSSAAASDLAEVLSTNKDHHISVPTTNIRAQGRSTKGEVAKVEPPTRRARSRHPESSPADWP